MQTFPVSNYHKQKSSSTNNPLKQLFSHNLSPKHKLPDNNKPKPTSINNFELGNKYTYSYNDLIGDGFTSKVYKGYEIQHPNKTYAIKVIQKRKLTSDQMKLIKNQIEVHPKLDHKNIVKCYDVFDTPKLIYVVMELCQNGDLAQYMADFKDKQIPQWRAIQMMEQIIQGCRYLVQQGILHRDLKPPNILRSGHTLKIADFGFSIKGKKTLIDSMSVGTPLYMPPESIEECVYSHKSDFFALGCIMYELLHGKTPWYKNDQMALAKVMKKSKIDLSKIKNSNIKYFIEKSCQISEAYRMSTEEFMQFDFRKAPMHLQLNIISSSASETSQTSKNIPRQKTDRRLQSKNSGQEQVAPKSTKSKKSQTAMQATFISNHIYFKNAKCEQIKKITADFEQKFELCLLLKYLIQNSEISMLLQDFDKKNLKIVMFRHCIFVFKKLMNDFVRTKAFDLKNWLDYKETKQFKLFEDECKSMKQKLQKQFNLQLKGMSLKNLSQINKKFPQLSTQYELSKSFYQKLKQFLRQIIRKFHQQIVKKFQKSPSLLSPIAPNCNSQYFQAFKSLFRYYQNCEQKLLEDDMNKSVAYNNSMIKTATTTQNSSNTSANFYGSNRANTSTKKQFPLKPQGDQISFGKKPNDNYHHFNHLSPEHQKISLLSPKSKYMMNKTAGKNFYTNVNSNQQTKNNQFLQVQSPTIHHHYYAYSVKPVTTDFDTESNVNSTVTSVYSPNKKMLNIKSQKYVKPESVQSHFSQVLCKNYEQSKMTKQEFIAIKKKIKWLW